MRRTSKRISQDYYDRILDAFDGEDKTFTECVDYLVSQGITYDRAKNAVHVYRKGGATEAEFRLSRDERNDLLDEFGSSSKPPKECVNYLMSLGCTYRQATSAVYLYRKERGLIGNQQGP